MSEKDLIINWMQALIAGMVGAWAMGSGPTVPHPVVFTLMVGQLLLTLLRNIDG